MIFKLKYQIPVILIGWGMWVFAILSFDSLHLYHVMSDLAGEHVWGAGFATAGLFGILSAWAADRSRSQKAMAIQAVGASTVAAGWFFIWLMLLLADWQATSTFIYSAILALSIINWIDVTWRTN